MLINHVSARYRFNIVYVKFMQKLVNGGLVGSTVDYLHATLEQVHLTFLSHKCIFFLRRKFFICLEFIAEDI